MATLVTKSKTIKVVLTNTIGDNIIDYSFEYSDNKINGGVSAAIIHTDGSFIGNVYSDDGFRFGVNVSIGIDLSTSNTLTAIQNDIKEIIDNTASYV